MADSDLTAERLQTIFNYDPETGALTNNGKRGRRGVAGASAKVAATGYIRFKVDGRHYMAHRLVWMYVTGCWPNDQIDHINGVKHDNRFANLREATCGENCQNRPKKLGNTSGFTGVRRHKSAWRADIKINGKSKFVGIFHSPELAYAAYLSAKEKVHTFQPVPR